MIFFYGAADRKLLKEMEENLNLIRTQMILLLEIQRRQQVTIEKILEALQAQVKHPAVGLKFAFGLPTRQ